MMSPKLNLFICCLRSRQCRSAAGNGLLQSVEDEIHVPHHPVRYEARRTQQ